MIVRVSLSLYIGALLWGLLPAAGLAQGAIRLKLQPKRIADARAVEQQAYQKKDSLLLAEAWYLYGKTYVFAGDFLTAQSYFLKSLRIQEPRGASFNLSRLYVKLSETESRLGRGNQALAYANQALRIARQSGSDQALLRASANLGVLYERHWGGQGQTDTAKYAQVLAYHRQAEALCYKLKDTMGIAEAKMIIGSFFAQHRDPQAITYLREALHLFRRHNKESIRVSAMLQLASAYLTFGKPKLAYAMLQEADQFYASRKLNEYDLKLGLETKFVDYFTATSQWKLAFDHLEKQHALERNQLLSDRDGAISRLNIEYGTGKKEVMLAAQRHELALRFESLQTQQRLNRDIAVLLAVAVGMSIGLFIYGRKNARVSRQNAELVKEQNHRVKNNLQVVSSLLSLQARRLTDEVAKQAVEESQLRVQSMAILHRRLYDGEHLARVGLDEFIRELVSGVLLTFGYLAVPVQYTIDPIYLSADKATPLGLILNELITNSCKYAFPGNDAPCLWIQCHQQGPTISLRVADNGPGLGAVDTAPAQNGNLLMTKTRTFGLTLIDAQVAQLNGTGHFDTDYKGLAYGTVFRLQFTI